MQLEGKENEADDKQYEKNTIKGGKRETEQVEGGRRRRDGQTRTLTPCDGRQNNKPKMAEEQRYR